MTEDNTISWSEVFHRDLVDKESELGDLLGLSIENLEDEFDNDEEKHEAEDCRNDIYSDWMILLEMNPNTIIDVSSDLGLHDIDQNYN